MKTSSDDGCRNMSSDTVGQIAIFIMSEALVKNGSGGLGNQDATLLSPQSVQVPHFSQETEIMQFYPGLNRARIA
ncbi:MULTISPECIES: hypothetical protein [Paraburkholderia]|uniref:hypothetical protein n=1 Tax=Paraburkholderia TaxID=1822464 RepID=UPI00224D31A4|nr:MULTISPECIES: hypothetical protein [Paraburkholderia]MCX4177666.1 hypothetical protein [Paraburkholderia madseniana]MDQ6465655.1 hypothetical protein [Paraburkholderia madseniana]